MSTVIEKDIKLIIKNLPTKAQKQMNSLLISTKHLKKIKSKISCFFQITKGRKTFQLYEVSITLKPKADKYI